jgi:conjugal transfer pilus assembly protein TraF
MRSPKKLTNALRFSTLLLILFLFSSDGHGQSHWWQRRDEGWFFYQDPLKKEEEKEAKKAPLTPLPEVLESSLPFTERMKKKGEELLSKAMESPTIENVKAYIEHNNLVMKLSENFSIAWQKALMMYPWLESPVPTSDADKDLYFMVEEEKEKEVLYGLSREAGIFFFYSHSCPYCERQAMHLRRFLLEYPFFIVKPITLDGGILSEFPETVVDNGISVMLGVERVPSIFLAFPPDRFERISSGLLTAEELKRRLIWYAKKTDANYSGAATGDSSDTSRPGRSQ